MAVWYVCVFITNKRFDLKEKGRSSCREDYLLMLHPAVALLIPFSYFTVSFSLFPFLFETSGDESAAASRERHGLRLPPCILRSLFALPSLNRISRATLFCQFKKTYSTRKKNS